MPFQHLLMYVEILGIITEVSQHGSILEFDVQDGTGRIKCVFFLPKDIESFEWNGFDLGQRVLVYGRASEFRGEPQISIQAMRMLHV